MKESEKNRKAWNQAILYHIKARNYDVIESIKNNKILDEREKNVFNNIDLKNKIIFQPCCNNGRELIALVKMFGAKQGIGFDISDEAIKEANLINKHFLLNVSFIRGDILNISKKYYDSFDIVYITVGTLNWISDLDEFFKLINNLLKKEGELIIYEMHPLSKIFPYFNSREYDSGDKYSIAYDYFNIEKDKYYTGIDYVGKTSYESGEVCEYSHTLSNVINALANNQFNINKFDEYKEDISSTYEHIAEKYSLPLSYILIATKMTNIL